ncbi:hypothetical protein [Tenacibaculum maritimum]|uniref:hypothetical protein n=1 Tax=Tenacibaculum maritimum TaxID=107401 RepID=UPI0038782619
MNYCIILIKNWAFIKKDKYVRKRKACKNERGRRADGRNLRIDLEGKTNCRFMY